MRDVLIFDPTAIWDELLFCHCVFKSIHVKWLSSKESACQCRRHRLNPWSWEIPHVAEQPGPGPQLSSLCSGAPERQLLKPAHPRAHALQQASHRSKKPVHRNYKKPTRQRRPSTPKTVSIQLQKNTIVNPHFSEMWVFWWPGNMNPALGKASVNVPCSASW